MPRNFFVKNPTEVQITHRSNILILILYTTKMILIVCRLLVFKRIRFVKYISRVSCYVNRVEKEFGKRVRHLRLTKHFSQEELASRAGVHRTYLGSIGRGERSPSLKNIAAIAKALDTTLPELFSFSPK
jgi:DNA-binding XRE family transcriptional regulator